MRDCTLKEKFLWGVALSSHQVEGDNKNNDWWIWEQQGNIENGESSGSACEFRYRYKDDLQLIKNLGCNAFRFSIEWSRIQPSRDQWCHSELDYYLDIVKQCKALGIEPMVTLHHFTLPYWVYSDGGFSNSSTVDHFLNYAKKVVGHLGAEVNYWCTFNEPMVYTVGAYLAKFMPPGEVNFSKLVAANFNIYHAHSETFKFIKSYRVDCKVGIAQNMLHFLPGRIWNPMDWLLAKYFEFLYNETWIRALTIGSVNFNLPFVFPRLKLKSYGKTCDFIGLNYYTHAYVTCFPREFSKENSLDGMPLAVSFAKPNESKSDLGWGFDSIGLLKILKKLGKRKVPIIITENGIADKSDTHRTKYILNHLKSVEVAKKSGVVIDGYFHWSLIDNFEWIKGFGPRFGLYEVDYKNQVRRPRKSALQYQKTIEEFNWF